MLMRALLISALLKCVGCAQLAKLASGPSPSFVAVKSYSIFLDSAEQTEIRFQAPVLTEQRINEEKDDVITYKAKSRDGVKIIIFAEKHEQETEHAACLAHHYAKSPDAITKYVKAVATETLVYDHFHSELSILQPRINIGKNKHFASAHAYFYHNRRCFNVHIIKPLHSERDKLLVSSILKSLDYNRKVVGDKTETGMQ